MGSSVSTNSDKQKLNISTQALNSCKPVTALTTADFENFTFGTPEIVKTCLKYGYDSDFTIDQTAGVKADCAISSVQNAIAKAAANMDAKTRGGFGIAFSTNVSDNNTKIDQYLKDTCGKVSASAKATFKDVKIDACKFHYVADVNAQSACKINALQGVAAQVSDKQLAAATGTSLFGALFGSTAGKVIGVIVGILILALIVYIIYKVAKGSSSDSSSSSSQDVYQADTTDSEQYGGFAFGFNIYSIMIIGIILLLLFYLYNPSDAKQRASITDKDLTNLSKSVKQAQKIAHIVSDSSSGFSTASCGSPMAESDGHLDDFYKPLL